MRDKPYYSLRTGKHDGEIKLDLDATKKLFLDVYRSFNQKDYFQEAFGYHCVDDGYVVGTAGQAIEGAMLLALRKDHLWPIEDHLHEYAEEALSDVVEFLHDHISKPLEGHYHSYYGCGMHYSTFNGPEGQAEFRAAVNPILACFDTGLCSRRMARFFTPQNQALHLFLKPICHRRMKPTSKLG